MRKTIFLFLWLVLAAVARPQSQPQPVPTGEIILTNEHELRGAGFDLGLRGGYAPDFIYDSGTFHLPNQGPDRRLAFDLCVRRTSDGPMQVFPADLTNFFRFTVRNADTGEIELQETRPLYIKPETFFENMVFYAVSSVIFYQLPAPAETIGTGKHTLTIETDPKVMVCAPVRFFIEINVEDIWMYAPPERAIEWRPFQAGVVVFQRRQ